MDVEEWILSPYEQRITKDDFLVVNGILYSVHTNKDYVEKSEKPLRNVPGSSRIPFDYFEKAVKSATHLFLASATIRKHNNLFEERRLPLAFAYVHSYGHNDSFELSLIASTIGLKVNKESREKKKFDKKYPKSLIDVEDEYFDDQEKIVEEFKKKGFDYFEWKKEFKAIPRDQRIDLKLGFGVILMREIMKHFIDLGKTSMKLYAAHSGLIPYYEKYGFKLALPGSECEEKNMVDNIQLAMHPVDRTFYMILCDLRKGYDLAVAWTEKHGVLPEDFWKVLQEEITYSISVMGQETSGRFL